MGVTGLWTVLQPCARPIKIETLNKKRLAVDASIWIYQFLKAVRDKEGNALRNSHIVGFFRRICKLLFIGIKPVFVFDGGAPALKRQTINSRKRRREGRREDALKTAGKLLAVQMQRVAEEEDRKRKQQKRRSGSLPRDGEEPQQEEIPEDVVYADEVLQTPQERAQNRQFKKKDQYHLPDLGVSLAEMGQPNDPRIMSLEELEEYARQFDTGEDINVYDFSKIDFDSPFFMSLPASDRYNILNAARLRSRLRMGYSKDQLDSMFPDRMAFSKFQIERVTERNELTQRLMNINGMSDDVFSASANRVAGEHGREYLLVKNEGVEGGWALGVVTNKDEGRGPDKPIDVDREPLPEPDEEDWEDDEFEDVPIEGLNRLPKPKPGLTARDREGRDFIAREVARRKQNSTVSRAQRSSRSRGPRPVRAPISQDPDSLFLVDEMENEEWESAMPVDEGNNDLAKDREHDRIDEEEKQLQKAIALSMQQGGEDTDPESEEEDIYREVFQQERAKDINPFIAARGSGMGIARLANQRSIKAAPAGPFNASDSEDDGMDLQAALAESRKTKRTTIAKQPSVNTLLPLAAPNSTPKSRNAPGFDGPLPFEKLNLGNSLLGKKKMDKLEVDNAGGFEKNGGGEKKRKTAESLPPWFNSGRNIEEEMAELRQDNKREWEKARRDEEEQAQFMFQSTLRKRDDREVVHVESPEEEKGRQVLVIESDDEGANLRRNGEVSIKDLAGRVRAEPPKPLKEGQRSPPLQDKALMGKENGKDEGPFMADSDDEPMKWSESEPEDETRTKATEATGPRQTTKSPSREFEGMPMNTDPAPALETAKSPSPEFEDVPMSIPEQQQDKSPSPEFEDVQMGTAPPPTRLPRREMSPDPLQGLADLQLPIVPHDPTTIDPSPYDQPIDDEDDEDQYSDPEDAELFASLAKEAEEHARFAQELNSTTTTNVNFDQELKQLRAQQKKDRRDADEVTQTMISECQHLLTLFGLPYITAPMEAEAQCAELVNLGLVDGIVTDDSDTFLFGGTRVYKNMFNAAKYVECYLASDLSQEFALTREKLIDIAQLLGSDYCPGIPGIGPVTALELLSEFPSLTSFTTWWNAVQSTPSTIPPSPTPTSFLRRFRRTNQTKLFLPSSFPSPQVRDAYLNPEVDSNPEPFAWGVPDLDSLRAFLSAQIGWSKERTDEVLVPVIRDMNAREREGTQANITRFFEGGVGAGAFAPRVRDGAGGKKPKGSRLGAALTRLAEREKGGVVSGEMESVDAESADNGNKRRRGKKVMAVEDGGGGGDEVEDEDEDEVYVEPSKKRARKSKKRA